MLHTHTCVWIHIIWATKNRERILHNEKGKQLFDFLINQGIELYVRFEKLYIQPEHVHALINLPSDQTLAKFMNMIKGGSSYWLNNHVFQSKFSWQKGYGAYSVSASQLERVKHYIANQHEHHKRLLFSEEYEKWKKKYGFFDD
jgi:REP element-mobilizing transposase RayT